MRWTKWIKYYTKHCMRSDSFNIYNVKQFNGFLWSIMSAPLVTHLSKKYKRCVYTLRRRLHGTTFRGSEKAFKSLNGRTVRRDGLNFCRTVTVLYHLNSKRSCPDKKVLSFVQISVVQSFVRSEFVPEKSNRQKPGHNSRQNLVKTELWTVSRMVRLLAVFFPF